MTTLRKEAAQANETRKSNRDKISRRDSAQLNVDTETKTPGNQRPLYDPDCFTQC